MCFIEAWKREGLSNREIARRLFRAPQTINNAVKKGTVGHVRRQKQNGKAYEYKKSVYLADVHYRKYQKSRSQFGRRPKWLQTEGFHHWADKLMKHEGWSPDACVGRPKRLGLFPGEEIPRTKSLYNWIEAGLLKAKNIDLTEKVRRIFFTSGWLTYCCNSRLNEEPFTTSINLISLDKSRLFHVLLII